MRELLDTFQSKDEEVVSGWNPFAGEVHHLGTSVQLQTYRMPWPFASREYLVRCEDVRQGKQGHMVRARPLAKPSRSTHTHRACTCAYFVAGST